MSILFFVFLILCTDFLCTEKMHQIKFLSKKQKLKMHKIANWTVVCIRFPFLSHMQAFLELFKLHKIGLNVRHITGYIIGDIIGHSIIETVLNYYTQGYNLRISELSGSDSHHKYRRLFECLHLPPWRIFRGFHILDRPCLSRRMVTKFCDVTNINVTKNCLFRNTTVKR